MRGQDRRGSLLPRATTVSVSSKRRRVTSVRAGRGSQVSVIRSSVDQACSGSGLIASGCSSGGGHSGPVVQNPVVRPSPSVRRGSVTNVTSPTECTNQGAPGPDPDAAAVAGHLLALLREHETTRCRFLPRTRTSTRRTWAPSRQQQHDDRRRRVRRPVGRPGREQLGRRLERGPRRGRRR